MAVAADFKLAQRFLVTHPPPGEPVLCAVAGSHLYGFPSADCELQLRGIHLAGTRELLGLSPPPPNFEVFEVFEEQEYDLNSIELGRALKLILGGNGHMLERILSPFQVIDSEHLFQLAELTGGAVSRRFGHHYVRLFEDLCDRHDRGVEPEARTQLGIFRAALTGAHLMRTGELLCDLERLATDQALPEACELIRRKRKGSDELVLSDEEDKRLRSRWPELKNVLDRSLGSSGLPETPANAEACSGWLVDLRVRRLGG
jgi:predicted nucleotidyltransferase